jgi:hypothetical protein
MDVAELLGEIYGRILPLAESVVAGSDVETLTTPVTGGANPIAWLVWHAARVQDDHVAEVMGVEQLWARGDWAPRFGLDPDPTNTGYGHTPAEVAAVRPDGPEVLVEYLGAVAARTFEYLRTLDEADLDRIVDRRWDPPVTLGVRLVSVADDSLQHLGQAAYARGMRAD